MGLIGPNGAGKTTIIKAGHEPHPPQGRRDQGVRLDNIRSEAEIKARIGFVYDNALFLR